MRRMAQLAIHLVVLTGWLVLMTAVGLWTLERGGGLRWLIEHEGTRRLAPLGEALHVERARLDWFQPALLLAGVELGPEGETLRLDQVRVTFPSLLPWGTDDLRIEAADGRVIVSQALINGLRGLTPGHVGKARRVPTVQIENVQVALDSGGRLGRVPLGRVDATLRADQDGRPALTGRLTPSLAALEGPGQIYIQGQQQDDGVYEVHAKAIDLPLSSDMVSERTAWTGLEPYAPRGLLALDARGRWSLSQGRLIDARVRLSLENGSLRAPAGDLALDEIGFELEAGLARGSEADMPVDVFDPAAWHAFGRGSAICARTPLRMELGWGPDAGPNAIASATLIAERAQLAPLAAAIASSVPGTDKWTTALEPRGRGTLRVGVRLAQLPPPERPILGALDVACAIDVDGEAGVTYAGFVSHLRGRRDIGFPLPVDHVSGRAIVAHAPGKLRTTRAGLIGLRGKGRQGALTAQGVLSSPPVDLPPYKPGFGYPEMDLLLAASGVPVDAELEQAFAALYGILPPSELWQRYRPSGGTMSATVRLTRSHDMLVDATEVRVGLHDVGLTWSELPVPMLGMNGEVVFVSDGFTGWGVGFHGEGRLRTARSVSIDGRFQRETPEVATGRIDVLNVDVERFSLAGDDQRVLTEVVAGLGESLARFEPRGFGDLAYRRVHAVSDGPTETTVEVTAGDPVRLTPAQFKMITSDVRGRVLVRLSEPARLAEAATPEPGSEATARMEVDVVPIVGTWGQDVEVAFLSSQTADGATRTRVFGAGIDPSSKSLLGSLAEALGNGNGGGTLIAADTFALDGRMDFAATLEAPAGSTPGLGAGGTGAATGTAELDGRYRFYLRDNHLSGADRLELSGLHGKLELDRGTLFGERLTGRLGRTPVVLSGATLTRNDRGFHFHTRLDARDVPLDHEHLASVLSEETLEPLIEELDLTGTIDVEAGQLTIEGPPEGGTRVEFKGTLRPHDVDVVLGLPLSVDSAAVRLHELVFETGKVRAWAEIEGLRGRVADRNVGPARMLVTYVQPRLSIENLDAVFEGGRAVPLGGGTARGGSAFSIDLVQPFPFQLAMDLRDVQIAGLLRGLFASSIAAQGTLSARMRLTGDTSRLLGLSGTGTFELNDSRLWSIPVFRALFSQLGLDDTAIFDSMSTNVRLRDGVIQTNDIEVHSPLLQLVGSGTVDLDGSLHHDLEVRYALLDYLGPLRRLIYSIQNRLLSVAIRGDMDRPSVKLRGPLSGILGARDDELRELPLPDFAALPERF